MLPGPDEVHELEIHDLNVLIARHFDGVFRSHNLLSSFARIQLYTASSPRSPVRIRTTSSTEVTKIFPSPIRPVRADFSIVSTTFDTMSSLTMISSLTFGRKSTTYSAPRYNSV